MAMEGPPRFPATGNTPNAPKSFAESSGILPPPPVFASFPPSSPEAPSVVDRAKSITAKTPVKSPHVKGGSESADSQGDASALFGAPAQQPAEQPAVQSPVKTVAVSAGTADSLFGGGGSGESTGSFVEIQDSAPSVNAAVTMSGGTADSLFGGGGGGTDTLFGSIPSDNRQPQQQQRALGVPGAENEQQRDIAAATQTLLADTYVKSLAGASTLELCLVVAMSRLHRFRRFPSGRFFPEQPKH